jgi:hypothetical protein
MALFFKDRVHEPIHNENARYYKAVGKNGGDLLPEDFKLVLQNEIKPGNTGDPVNAANMNFSSGNVSLPAPVPSETRPGRIMSFSSDGVIPAFTPPRPIAANGPLHTESESNGGIYRLSDTRYLLLYHNRAIIATINFNAKTVTFGNPLTWTAFMVRSETMGLVQDFDEAPHRAIVAGLQLGIHNQLLTYSMRIDENAAVPVQMNSIALGEHTNAMSSVVGVGNSFAVVCTRNSSSMVAWLLNYSGASATLAAQITLPVTGAMSASNSIGLFCYDRSRGRCVFIYRQSGSIFAVPINVTGSTITAGALQTVGIDADILFQSAFETYMPSGTDRFSVRNGNSGGRIILMQNTPNSSIRMQILNADPSGRITKGAIYLMPVMNSARTGTISLTNKSDSKIYVMGGDFAVTPRDSCLVECEIKGTELVSLKTYHPFQSLRIINDSEAGNALKHCAVENPGNPGEFMFMQQFDGRNNVPLNRALFWFGNINDNFRPANIIGVALDNPENGHVRIQTSPKYIPGLFGGLIPGRLYRAGENGGLLPFTGAANTKPVGIAVNENDLQFFGAMNL